jgi:transcriptional regulator with XRE-family HTH domain
LTDSQSPNDPGLAADGLVAAVAANVRGLRGKRGWSLAEAASAAAIGKSTWAQLESGQANPSLETMWAIAQAFEVPVSALLGTDNRRSRVLRASEGTEMQSETHVYKIRQLLSLRALNGGVDVTVLETEPEPQPRRTKPHHPGSVEHLLVMQGRMRVCPVGEEEELSANDLISFPGDVEHTYHTLEPNTRSLVFMEFR